MTRVWTTLLLFTTWSAAAAAGTDTAAAGRAEVGARAQPIPPLVQILPIEAGQLPLTVRPAMLGDHIDELAGRLVQVAGARVVGMFGPRVLVVDTATRLQSVHRTRVLVFVDEGAIRVPADLLVGSTVRVFGVARSLLGMQVSREVPWPPQLDRARLDRLDVRAAVLATSIQTAEGIELTDRVVVPALSAR